ncbi:MAG: dethiobiotin synthase [Gammaproteobacteria bacterium]
MKLFITGTDTNIGKTYVSCGILKWLNNAGFSTIALKPLASGCQQTHAGLINEDACALQAAASIYMPLSRINPLAFEPPVAPHIPAEQHNIQLTANLIVQQCQTTLATQADYYVIEGVGGWLMPINTKETMADVALQLQAKIILVVGMRLGCLNHALLTYQAIKQKNCSIVGWIANCIETNMLYQAENIAMLQQQIAAPLLGIIPYGATVEEHLHKQLFLSLTE